MDALISGNEVGKQAYKTYENEKGEKVKAILESNFAGSGYKEADLVISEELALATNKPITIDG